MFSSDVVDIPTSARPRTTYAVVSTFPPTPCGIATFSAALCSGLTDQGGDVVRVPLSGDGRPDPVALRAASDADVAIVQHEYGIYAGRDGDSVVDLLRDLDQPAVVVAHTVLGAPTPNQRAVLEAIVDAADAVVVMTDAGRRRLCSGYDVDPAKVSVIVHGAAVVGERPTKAAPPRQEVLTWGLLGPGKGIEWAIDAIGALRDVDPPVTYRIAGDTHPKVAATHGEAYREMLEGRAADAGVSGNVRFDKGYRGLDDLARMIAAARVVVLPYDSPDQVTSGVLVDAVAAGRPVVATAFPHAVELLASGAGITVPRRDPEALGAALRRVLTEDGLADRMAAEARRIAPGLAWPAVARRYAQLGDRLLAGSSAAVA